MFLTIEINFYVILNLPFSNFHQLYNVKIHRHIFHKKTYNFHFLHHYKKNQLTLNYHANLLEVNLYPKNKTKDVL